MVRPTGRKYRLRGRWIFRGLLLAGVVAAAVTIQLSASHQAAKISAPGATIVVPFTGFGGYSWTGKVENISAEWQVPRISDESNFGYASTWIGVQNEVNNQFVQVGIIENYLPDEPTQYEAFWSDLAVGFSPKTFGVVIPGDEISASMSRSVRGWSLRFEDLTRHLTGKQFIRVSPDVPFSQGEWIQEDPTQSTSTSQDLPYPKMSEVTFEDVKINETTPQLSLNDGQVLIASGGTIGVPTVFRDDSFSLQAPSGTARQYLYDEQSLDAALSQFDVQLSQWGTLSRPRKRSATEALTQALTEDERRLTTQRWGQRSQKVIRLLVESDQHQRADVDTWSNSGFDDKGVAFRKFQDELSHNIVLINDLRDSLRLPPL